MKLKKNRIIFLTSTNLASNPRCLKEVEWARELGHEVIVFAFDLPNWTRDIEIQIRNRFSDIEYYSLQAARTPKVPWLINSLAGKLARFLLEAGWQSALINATVTDKRTLVLLSALNKKKPQGDIIIAHNPGAFYPAWWYSRKTKIPFALDIEDYHPGENNGGVDNEAVMKVMKLTLPHANYVSFASPLIKETTLSLFNKDEVDSPFVINNVFPSYEFPKPASFGITQTNNDKLKLVWFSQHISFNRGLDDILPCLQPFTEKLELTLIGNLDPAFKNNVLDKYTYIVIKGPMPQEKLNASLGEYDIGLALESNNSDENRKICLTNKIWSYLQAGLYIWATDTPAQLQFAQEFPMYTQVIGLDNKKSIESMIQKTIEMLPDLRRRKIERWETNQKNCWETERVSLANQWNTILRN